MAHLMWVGPHMAINSRAFHLLKHTKSLRAREERFEKKKKKSSFKFFKEESTKNISIVFFLRVSKNTESIIFLRV
jgi:hypothetical protein